MTADRRRKPTYARRQFQALPNRPKIPNAVSENWAPKSRLLLLLILLDGL